ncbi:MAG TPA: 2TM domain-containing protein [Burkholderiales bacterium]|nr:2TM domain-containing protein [Burkholderiales bacterium]
MSFRSHLIAYLIVNGVLTAVNVVMGRPWWAFWPLILWGLALMLHFLVHRARTVDESWVEERTQDLRSKSYDASHIDDIREHPAPSLQDKARQPPGR